MRSLPRIIRRKSARRHQQSRRLFLESLEPRQMMAVVSISGPYVSPSGIFEGTSDYFLIERDSADPDPLTVNFTITGDSIEAADFAAIGTSIVIPADETYVQLDINTIADTDFEPVELFAINLDASLNYTLGTSSSATAEIRHCSGYEAGPLAFPPTCSTCPPGPGQATNGGSNEFWNPELATGGRITSNGFWNPELATGGRISSGGGGSGGGFESPPFINPDSGVQGGGLPGGVQTGFSTPGFSSHPVRYSDGVVMIHSQDLQSDGMGVPWGITRSWTNAQAHYRQNEVGTRMLLSEQPYITNHSFNNYYVFTNSTTAQAFTLTGGVYVARDFAQEKLVHDAVANEYVLTDTEGGVLRLFDLSTNHPALKRGQFKSFTDANGNTVSVTSHTTEGRIAEVQRSYTEDGNTITESYLYTHLTTLVNNGLLESVEQRRRVGAGSWVTQRKVEYAYYNNGEANGNRGDLKTATIKDASNNVLDTTYYRYYKPGEANGFTHGLKYVLGPESYARFAQEVGSPLTASNTALAPYADNYFEYDSFLKVTKEVAQGAGCSACSGGQGTFTYSYTGTFNGGYTGNSDYNAWTRKTVETLPDGNRNIVYANFRGQVMLQIYKDTATSQEWATYYRYDSAGRVLFRAEASAVSGYSEANPALVKGNFSSSFEYLRDGEGLITDFTYYTTTTATTTTPGGATGYLQQVSLRKGEYGDSILQSAQNYIARTVGSTTIYLPATTTNYANANGTGGLTSSHAYTFFSGTVQVESQTTTTPSGDVVTMFRDSYGRPTWIKDAKGFLHYTAYDNQTGAVTKTITDVNSANTGGFIGKPSGWTTPSGGGLHLTTTYEVDGLGRPTKETDANGNFTYIVYNDTNHEVRVYPGWNTSNNLPTGPTIVVREDKERSYTEVLTMSATPNLTSGRPNGTEAISSLQTLSRTQLSDAGQAIYEDYYVSFTGISYGTSATLGTQGTNYFRTEMGYDTRGRHAKTVRPDGTIFRTVFDGLGRPVSEWVGNDDIPDTGFWSPTNPAGMVKLKEYQYDAGGVGDSLLTRISDALSRHTALAYDFRGRLTTATLPDPDATGPLTSPVYLTTYDNLDRVTSQTDPLENTTSYAYDTANRKTTISLPDPDAGGPAASPVVVWTYDAAGLLLSMTDPLLAVTTYETDGAWRIKKTTDPDPDGAGSQTSPITQYSYDGVGNLRFLTDPLNHVTEHTYDKANRQTQTIAPDPDGAGSLTSPVKAYAYDSAGRLWTVTDPLTRITTHEYDALGRLKKITQPDPDAGGPLAAPVTQWSYDAAGRQTSVTDPLSNVTTYAYNFFDQLTTLTEADPDGAGSLTSPITTYTYNNASELLSQTDPLSRTTNFTYDNLSRRTKATLPDPDAGGPLTRPETTFSYDAAGNLLQRIDPLGNRKVYQYDNLYRTIAEKQTNGDVPAANVATTTEGATINEVQRVGVTSGFTFYTISGGTFTLTYSGQTTSAIAYNASAATVQAALEALSNIGVGDVSVTKLTDTSLSQTWELEFQGALAGTNVAQVTIDTSGLTNYYYLTKVEVTDIQGSATSEVQVVTLTSTTGGTFTLSLGGQTTAAIAYNASAATVDTELEALGAVDTVTVTGNAGGPYTITFTGTQTGQNVGLLGLDDSSLTSANLLSTTRYTYDAAGRMLTLKDPVNNTTTWQYDTLGRVTQETNQLSKTRTFKHDAASNLIERVDRLGRKIEYVYDNLYRNTSEKWYDGVNLVRTLSFAYSATDRLTSASDPAASYTYSYDALDRVTSEGQTILGLTPTINYASKYDAASRRTELQAAIGGTNDFQNTYTYDNVSRLTRLQQQDVSGGNVVADKRIDFAYDASGAFTKIDRYADLAAAEHVVSTHYSYDGIGRLAKLLHTEGPTAPGSGWGTDTLAGYQYVYDPASRFTSIDSFVDGLTSYTHDGQDQLTGADHTGMTDETYTYDANGNRTISGYSTGTNNQLSTDGTYNYTYDDEGNRLTRTKISNGKKEEYTWDHRNRLTKVTYKDSDSTVTKTVYQWYDVFNQWVRRCVDPNGSNEIDTWFSYDDGQIVLQFDDGGAASDLAHRYLWNSAAIDQLVTDEQVSSLASAGTMLWPLGDHLGTLRDLANYNTTTDDTAIANHRRYDSYGKLISETNAVVDEILGFTGRMLDESTGLQNNLNRWYDSTTGQWISEDPLEFEGGDDNIYRYVENVPTFRTDPSGLIWADHRPYDPDNLGEKVYYPFPYRNLDNLQPATEELAIAMGFRKCLPSKSVFHWPHTKYVGPDGRYEAVYDKDGNLVIGPGMGSYNYYDYETDPLLHFFFDMIPACWDFSDHPGSIRYPPPAPPRPRPQPGGGGPIYAPIFLP